VLTLDLGEFAFCLPLSQGIFSLAVRIECIGSYWIPANPFEILVVGSVLLIDGALFVLLVGNFLFCAEMLGWRESYFNLL
jgi:hypothetical protein